MIITLCCSDMLDKACSNPVSYEHSFTFFYIYNLYSLLHQRAASAAAAAGTSSAAGKNWSDEETQLLVKGVNMFPAGTANRWEVIASFIVQHASSKGSNLGGRWRGVGWECSFSCN